MLDHEVDNEASRARVGIDSGSEYCENNRVGKPASRGRRDRGRPNGSGSMLWDGEYDVIITSQHIYENTKASIFEQFEPCEKWCEIWEDGEVKVAIERSTLCRARGRGKGENECGGMEGKERRKERK